MLLVFVLYVEEREGVWTVYCLYHLLLFRKIREREREREIKPREANEKLAHPPRVREETVSNTPEK